ncbi:hypothetical protein ONZ45_g6433 [Pleurotus djamor]|nr:hypothetical protein ONZ45_g6433 [Pleurotus djamor]
MSMADVTPRPYNSVEIQTAIAAAQDEAAALPLDNYDTVTVNGHLLGYGPGDQDSGIDVQPFKRLSVVESFDAPSQSDVVEANDPIDIPFFEFSDFAGDLSLSPASSPTPSISSEPRAGSPSSVASPESPPRMSTPPRERRSRDLPSPQLSPVKSATMLRGSWPLVKYVGRGTPIDRTRRSQWGGSLTSDVGEDGVLCSTTVRSSSLDSAVQSTARSISPDWNYVSQSLRSPLQITMGEPEGPVADHLGLTDRLQASPKEWSEFMQGLLETTAKESAAKAPDLLEFPPPHVEPVNSSAGGEDPEIDDSEDSNDTPETQTARQSEEGHAIKVDLGSETVLDLSLSVGPGVERFPFPEYASGRASPSIYSTAPPTPPASRPPSHIEQGYRHSVRSEDSTTSSLSLYDEAGKPQWWRKFLTGIGRMQKLRRLLRSLSHNH